ncbi:hypothetical protein BAUCODRAFT_142735 [Baudoinia panamericana UAMH 10762]|uniref:SMP-30/Gluconolactonase/LRE-like region domain-containing protein n=1 Tax=Baudoinia panamericana (strain UAMH 10762) TaxID=717646 RepID=M2MLA0_BAUPA|nr:uncharacterized protein BAUCODRAFT_142735 [Baudoinia panamericana UAMH 10762]EMC92158.1 hypothetical protein BAUCODRAFT_142735 [Baudoinia panamericana UAMH 10762]
MHFASLAAICAAVSAPFLSTRLVNGISLTPEGRVFLVFQRVDNSTGLTIVEYNRTTNTSTAYPNAVWNNYTSGADPGSNFVGANAQRIGPDGNLYVVDTGQVGGSGPVLLPYGPKLLQINVTTNTVTRIYPMGNATSSSSHLDDVRFHNVTGKAYPTDAGYPGLIVLNLASGDTRRALSNDLSTREYMPASATCYTPWLEVLPDGQWLYYEPSSGGMSRIETKWLDGAFYNSTLNDNSILDRYVQPFAHTPSTGDTAIDAQGNVYNSDIDSQRVVKINPNVDAMWIDRNGTLWMPANQLNRGTGYNNGTSRIVKPLDIFTIHIGIGPSPINHA